MNLSERMKHWSALTVHRVAEIEAELLSFEERLTALEPKKVEVRSGVTPPFVPLVPIGPAPAPSVSIPEPSVLPAPVEPIKPTPPLFVPTPAAFEPVRLGPTPSTHDNPLDGTSLKS